MEHKKWPRIIQGGMGIAVSDWRLAATVAQTGQMGVVSGTAINSVLIRRLADGDRDGSMREAIAQFPNADIAKRVLEEFFIEGGKGPDKPYKRAGLFTLNSPLPLLQQTVLASFVEVWLAKNKGQGTVGLNLLEKIVLPNLACLYGALLAGVDFVIMGAGIPKEIPGALDLLSQNLKAKLKVPVEGSSVDYFTEFDPAWVMEGKMPKTLKRPHFLPIVSSASLALNLKKKSTGSIQGFIVESPLAGGHNAPPRGPMTLNEMGEPIYGPRDEVEFEDLRKIELPFYMAGNWATPLKLKNLIEQEGAQGIQVGTLFAFSDESGVTAELKKQTIEKLQTLASPKVVFTDPRSSPTGFPFKAVRLEGTASEQEVYQSRKRICDLGYLRHAYLKTDGQGQNSVGLRCPSEPEKDYLKKGGDLQDTIGRKCLCNALFANIGQAQLQFGQDYEKPLLTAGDDLNALTRILKAGESRFSAKAVIEYLLSEL